MPSGWGRNHSAGNLTGFAQARQRPHPLLLFWHSFCFPFFINQETKAKKRAVQSFAYDQLMVRLELRLGWAEYQPLRSF